MCLLLHIIARIYRAIDKQVIFYLVLKLYQYLKS